MHKPWNTRDYQQLATARRDKGQEQALEPSEGARPYRISISDFQPPEL
jgi:hypothetical protein